MNTYVYGSAAEKLKQEDELKIRAGQQKSNQLSRSVDQHKRDSFMIRFLLVRLLVFALLGSIAFCCIISYRHGVYIYGNKESELQEQQQDNALNQKTLQMMTAPAYVKWRAIEDLGMTYVKGDKCYLVVNQGNLITAP